jgi:hypothetical protein
MSKVRIEIPYSTTSHYGSGSGSYYGGSYSSYSESSYKYAGSTTYSYSNKSDKLRDTIELLIAFRQEDPKLKATVSESHIIVDASDDVIKELRDVCDLKVYDIKPPKVSKKTMIKAIIDEIADNPGYLLRQFSSSPMKNIPVEEQEKIIADASEPKNWKYVSEGAEDEYIFACNKFNDQLKSYVMLDENVVNSVDIMTD